MSISEHKSVKQCNFSTQAFLKLCKTKYNIITWTLCDVAPFPHDITGHLNILKWHQSLYNILKIVVSTIDVETIKCKHQGVKSWNSPEKHLASSLTYKYTVMVPFKQSLYSQSNGAGPPNLHQAPLLCV